jgi:polyisoprenoid-binding protein YceI
MEQLHNTKTKIMSKWIIDPLHSDVHFKARHLLISWVTGEFKQFEGSAETASDDFSDTQITFSADTGSIHTNNEKRDKHLKEEDFFNVAIFPTMTFISTAFTRTAENEYMLMGNLTIKTGTKPVTLHVVAGGKSRDSEGKERMGFEVTGKLNRYDFGLVWSLLSESGAIILGEEVKVNANIELVKAP